VCDALVPDISTVRAPFEDGAPVYPGSRIASRAHVQVCVRDSSCYVSPFRLEGRV
jgi:hypothetical protein